jgi:tRNA threonylcarbamoyladenosine biosynthesis protein TsaB
MSWILAVDTSLQGVSMALTPLTGDHKGSLKSYEYFFELSHSAQELPVIFDRACEALKINLKDIKAISLTIGPGTFTGLRIGFSYVLGLAKGLDGICSEKILWRGYSSLKILARKYSDQSKRTIVYLPSTRTTGYFAFYDPQNHSDIEASLDLTKKDQRDTVMGLKPEKSFLIGSWDYLISSDLGVSALSLDHVLCNRQILEFMCADSANQWPRGFSASIPILNYLKKSSVEEAEDSRASYV